MKIIRAMVILSNRADKVSLATDLPEPVYPYDGALRLYFSTAINKGAEYVGRHFPGVPVEVINARDETSLRDRRRKEKS